MFVCPEPVLANHRVFPTGNRPTNRRRPSVVVRRCPFDSVDSFWLATNVSVRDGPSSVGAGEALVGRGTFLEEPKVETRGSLDGEDPWPTFLESFWASASPYVEPATKRILASR